MSSKKYFFNQKTSRQENIFLQNYVSSFLDGVLFEHLFLINGFLIKNECIYELPRAGLS